VIVGDFPPPTPEILIELASTDAPAAPKVLFGFVAEGDLVDLDRISKEAEKMKVSTERSSYHGNDVRVWSSKPGDSLRIDALWRRAARGEFGKLNLRLWIVDRAAAKDGISLDELEDVNATKVRQ
jgi:predicted GTPase